MLSTGDDRSDSIDDLTVNQQYVRSQLVDSSQGSDLPWYGTKLKSRKAQRVERQIKRYHAALESEKKQMTFGGKVRETFLDVWCSRSQSSRERRRVQEEKTRMKKLLYDVQAGDPEMYPEPLVEKTIRRVGVAPIFGFFGRVGTNVWYSICLLFTLVVYITIGAVAFKKLETGDSFQKLTDRNMLRREMLEYFTMDEGHIVNDTLTNQTVTLHFTREDWDILYRISKGRCFKADAKDAKNHLWNFWSSMDFASTILTTIGYGGMVPSTTTGKLLVIVYGLPGMLLMMSYLNLFANCILKIINKIWKLIEKLIKNIGGSEAKTLSKFATSVLSAFICFIMLVAYLMIMSYILASSNTNDSFLKSLYFYTITMTTVGLGDIAVIDHLWYGVTVKVLVVFCIGLALVTTLFGALRDMAAENRKRVVEVTCKLAEKARRVELNGIGHPALSTQPQRSTELFSPIS
ncbi:hypothetical protein ACHWQZ_G007521 [Mnemiopsis leidyi]